MQENRALQFIDKVLKNQPKDWLGLTTHRLDVYNEEFAKTEFLEKLELLFKADNIDRSTLAELPTAYDYIRLGHPLSCILEWGIGQLLNLPADNIISFQSQTVPVLAVLRKNLLDGKKTRIIYSGHLPKFFDAEKIRKVYGYDFELNQVASASEVDSFDGTNIFLSNPSEMGQTDLNESVDFYINIYGHLGSVLIANGSESAEYISGIQHVRRRETVAMTPSNSLIALEALVGPEDVDQSKPDVEKDKSSVLKSINEITGTQLQPLVGSSGLSVQYAIMMGMVDSAQEHHPGKSIKFLVPPNCYGGTNDQARRVAACLENVEVVDLPVDGDNDMVSSVDRVLDQIAQQDAVPFIIAEIPTNPRVEVPDLEDLRIALSRKRTTPSGSTAIDPVFILDQTFCPNYLFLGEGKVLSEVRTISYASGSKFPSGGKCTAGYCVGNNKTEALMNKVALHLELCDNEATAQQYEILAQQLPSMNERIKAAYENTREFVTFIQKELPEAKINFVSEELAAQGFTPSVFSMDLPTKGSTPEERETYKRALNLKLIHLMIDEIPLESKFCVSYGQLKGCYWTVPATSTQGTTKEGDKDYIVRASLSPDLDLERHKEVFKEFVESI
ncbi:Cys/Met metabolism PLP-dependent enzyme [Nonlabens sp. Hel1_33_55]|uniref:PLP-dependent transferase n=1 Tax=Nonlabens sp. Hel1_33_55 TaxID=1336802 RepID=UPI000875BA5C|nr:PLP-dependent transferase [Nonlabens sp. Hel1_33_55]SCY02332.1 Cys/Met metabolism PLP-dependent enzyme [Nonlabens sp. Hel1_33_55]